ncbi:MAG: polysaccharide lyase beta-sandwich domain-containing protein [Tannerella sp.]|jgi:chondroitin AC lyase|nr:polysaccharide lyase beta-sandwich domain-containing protein [Tannerella sp.]
MNLRNFFIVLLLASSFGCEKPSDFEIIRDRISKEYTAPAVDNEHIADILATMQEDGTWPGIDYADTSRIAFRHTVHLDNMVQMARAYVNKSSRLRGDKALKAALDKALDYWLENDFVCENWWNNQIGTPTAMLSILYTMDKKLSRKQTEEMLRIAGRANMNASGARPSGDRVKIAALLAKTLAFERDEEGFEDALRIIEGEMKYYKPEDGAFYDDGRDNENYFPSGRGLQADYSFHHRIDRVNNTTSYGVGFFTAFVEFATLAEGTKYAFAEEPVQLAVDYYLDGVCKQMVFGRTVDPGVMNRDIARYHSPAFASAEPVEALLSLTDYRSEELENIAAARRGEPSEPESFAKFFWQSEHFVFQRPGFYTSVRMYSVRNRNMEEPYNGEGLTNHYRGDGANYLSIDGSEYLNITPVFNFRKVPGATIVQADTMPDEGSIQKDGLTEFVGAVTDGLYGAVAFDFISPHNPLSARKAWFFFDDKYVCLGTDINSTDRAPVATTVNQCYLEGPVTVDSVVLPQDEYALDSVLWVHHDSVGYIFPAGSQGVMLKNRIQPGTWKKANRQKGIPGDFVEAGMFTLWIDHGVKPTGGKYEYIVMPAADTSAVAAFAAAPDVEVIENSKFLQAVRSDKIVYYIFYRPAEVAYTGNLTMFAHAPCAVMLRLNDMGRIEELTVSDPTRELEYAEFTFNTRVNTITDYSLLSWNTVTDTCVLSVRLPVMDNAGKSRILPFKNDF